MLKFKLGCYKALILAAFIESHQVQVFRAKRHLTDRSKQEQILKERDNFRGLVESTHNKIDTLNNSQASLENSREKLIARRNLLIQELSRIDHEIANVGNDLTQITLALEKLKEEKKEHTRQAYQLLKNLQLIPSSADDDNREI